MTPEISSLIAYLDEWWQFVLFVEHFHSVCNLVPYFALYQATLVFRPSELDRGRGVCHYFWDQRTHSAYSCNPFRYGFKLWQLV